MITASETPGADVAIIGFGFSGLATLAHVVRAAPGSLRVSVIAPQPDGLGMAYQTRLSWHVLNVTAANMGIWAEEPGDFIRWLTMPEAAGVLAACSLPSLPAAEDFVPRMLYAHYLTATLRQVVLQAEAKGIHLAWIPQHAMSVTSSGGRGWQVRTTETVLHARQLVLATGHEAKPLFAGQAFVVQNPWTVSEPMVRGWRNGTVAVIGTGLSAVDTILSLRQYGHHGMVVAISRHGWWPQVHRLGVVPVAYEETAWQSIQGVSGLLRTVRQKAGEDWRAAVDGLRPMTPQLWQHWPADTQRRAIRYASLWNIHRHRMAPHVAAQMRQAMAEGASRTIACRRMHLTQDGTLRLQRSDAVVEDLSPVAIINCTGPQMDWAESTQPLQQQMLRDGICQRHPTGLGVVADARYRIGPQLYGIGQVMAGQFWESTAVPELRRQAASIGKDICSFISAK